MKVRLRFTKSGALVYIGHLDVMRYFQKLFRRAQIPVKYSEGFSPHQILSFSHPLPLGMESEGEYADVELEKTIDTKTAMENLARESVREIKILSFKQLPEKCENAMASVKAARYRVRFEGRLPFDDAEAAVRNFMSKDSIIILKKTKKNENLTDIRPLIYELEYDKETETIEMLISSGSRDNIKPELVLTAMTGSEENAGLPPLCITRIDQYTLSGEELISLDDIGSEII